jgi:hypothetical protein
MCVLPVKHPFPYAYSISPSSKFSWIPTYLFVCETYIGKPFGTRVVPQWLDMVITSSEFGQRLLVTIWFYCVSGFATSEVNCGTTRVPKGLPS